MKIRIYTGLSLSAAAVAKLLPGAECAPPIKRNDLYRDLEAGVHVVGILDGEFLQSLAVAPTEIMDAMRCGIRVYGSSSMGALRAAELHEYGMVGVGKIFERICETPHFKDDHLGQVFFEGVTDAAASLPMVDFELALASLRLTQPTARRAAASLRKRYEALHFSHRDLRRLRADLAERPGRLHAHEATLLARIERSTVRAKTADGEQLLKRISRDLAAVQRIMAAER